ncbi:MAG TPA: hypothetical protein VK545_22760 [Streptomyces sp.]|nr:hypothetical protein [Streptomyces sp.]
MSPALPPAPVPARTWVRAGAGAVITLAALLAAGWTSFSDDRPDRLGEPAGGRVLAPPRLRDAAPTADPGTPLPSPNIPSPLSTVSSLEVSP